MGSTGITVLDGSTQKTLEWIDALRDRTAVSDRPLAFAALRAVLHALRDHLTTEEAAQLAAQLPTLLRGVFFEGWKPGPKARSERGAEQFLQDVVDCFPFPPSGPALQPRAITRAVFDVLAQHVSAGEIAQVKRILPRAVREILDGDGAAEA